MHRRNAALFASTLFLACMAAWAAPASIVAPAEARQGDPLFVVAWPGDTLQPRFAEMATFVRILYADGSISPKFPTYIPPKDSLGASRRAVLFSEGRLEGNPRRRFALFALAGVPMDAMPGPAIISLESATYVMATAALTVLGRDFGREEIRLSPGLTSLRVDPDPRKDEQAKRYFALLATADPAAVFLDAGFARPVAGDRQTSRFGLNRVYRYSTGSVSTSVHNGIDYGYPTGTPVAAAGAGRVVMAEDRIATGKTVAVEHLPGVFTIYMHMSAMDVAVGDTVARGASIGLVGATGLATGPHLHWELRIAGIACDPEGLLGLDKVPSIRTILPAIEGG